MKFVIIQCAKAYHQKLEQIFRSIDIDTYSEMDVKGFMRNADGNSGISNWFGSKKNPYNYLVAFIVLDQAKADGLLQRIEDFNKGIDKISPINAYVTGVEKFV